MQKLASFTLSVLFLFGCATTPQPANNEQQDASQSEPVVSYSIPGEINIGEEVTSDLCDSLCLIDRFHPIGWSEDGKYFSWITQSKDEIVSGYYFAIYVQDMVENEVIWEWMFQERNLPNWDNVSRYDMVKVWNEFNDSIVVSPEETACLPNSS